MSQSSEQVTRMAELFNAVSDSYDAIGVDFFQPIAFDLVKNLDPRPGENWLDIGCGRGAVVGHASAAVGKTGKIFGFDISERMIENAKAMAKGNNLNNVEFIVDDAQSPQKVSDKFDIISSCLVLFFLPDPLSALKSWREFLNPDGRIGITTFAQQDPNWGEIDSLFAKYLPPQFLDARTSGAQGPFESNEGMENLLTAAGYKELKTMTTLLPVKFASFEKWHEFSWSTGGRAMWLKVPENDRPKLRAEAEEKLKAVMNPDGSIDFTQEIRHTLARM